MCRAEVTWKRERNRSSISEATSLAAQRGGAKSLTPHLHTFVSSWNCSLAEEVRSPSHDEALTPHRGDRGELAIDRSYAPPPFPPRQHPAHGTFPPTHPPP